MVVDSDKCQTMSDCCFLCLLPPVTLLVWITQCSLLGYSKLIILHIKAVQALMDWHVQQ